MSIFHGMACEENVPMNSGRASSVMSQKVVPKAATRKRRRRIPNVIVVDDHRLVRAVQRVRRMAIRISEVRKVLRMDDRVAIERRNDDLTLGRYPHRFDLRTCTSRADEFKLALLPTSSPGITVCSVTKIF
jgi:hypothetical protein